MRHDPLSTPSRVEGDRSIVLIGFQSMGNLGLGYLAATLRQAGHDVRAPDIEMPEHTLVDAVRRADPMLVGFSLIFQFYIRRYATQMAALRAAGIDAHFTMGGHYATLSPDETLRAAPDLDCVVRYEGEITVLKMVRALTAGDDWRGLEGHAWSLLAVRLMIAALSAFVAIWGLMRTLERVCAWPFVAYRGVIGIVLLVGAAQGWLS